MKGVHPMSKEAVVEFLNALDSDPSVWNELGSRSVGSELAAGEVVDFAARNGFDFTVEEFSSALEGSVAGGGEELSDDDLEAVAGGSYRQSHLQIGGSSFQNLGIGMGSEKGIVIINGKGAGLSKGIVIVNG